MSADPALAMLVPSPHGPHDAHASRFRRASQATRDPVPEAHSEHSDGHRPDGHPLERPRLPYEAIERAQRARVAQSELRPSGPVGSSAPQEWKGIATAAVTAPNQADAVTNPADTAALASSATPTDWRPPAAEALSPSAPTAVRLDAALLSQLPESAVVTAEERTPEVREAPHSEGAALTPELRAAGPSSGEGDVGRWSGSVPILFAGELVELDLYARHQGLGAAREGMSQLTLSLLDANGRRLEASASLNSNRLRVQLTGPAAGTYGTTRIQVRAVGELAARLGWTFEAVDHADARPDGEALNQLF